VAVHQEHKCLHLKGPRQISFQPRLNHDPRTLSISLILHNCQRLTN